LDLLAPLYCPPCQGDQPQHELCLGWTTGFCGCTSGLCGLRLITGVMWDIQQPNQQGEP
jgi:hypothetical protein